MKKRTLLMISLLSLTSLLLLAGCNKETPATTTSSTSSSADKMSSSLDSSTPTEEQDNGFAVSLQEAIALYQEAYPESDITSINLEHSLGQLVYKVEGVNDTTEFELKINANTKETVEKKEEPLDQEDAGGAKRETDKLSLDNLVPITEITTIAETEVGAGTATDWELEKEVGITYWKVTVKDGHKEVDVKINAQTKEVLEVEIDD